MVLDPPVLIAFVAASIAVYVTPGVDMAYIGSTSISHGSRAGLWAAAGTVIGVSIQALLAALGVTALFAASPIVFELVRWAGVAYLAWLGVRLLLNNEPVDWEATQTGWSARARLAKGMAINLLNPKVALFFAAFLPQFVDPSKGAVLAQLATLGALFAGGAILWCTFLALLFARMGDRFRSSQRFALWQRRVTGTAFLAFAGILGVADLRK